MAYNPLVLGPTVDSTTEVNSGVPTGSRDMGQSLSSSASPIVGDLASGHPERTASVIPSQPTRNSAPKEQDIAAQHPQSTHEDSDHESSTPTLHSASHEKGISGEGGKSVSPNPSNEKAAIVTPLPATHVNEKTGIQKSSHHIHGRAPPPVRGNTLTGGVAGEGVVGAMGLTQSLSRRISQPPAVSPWGGVAPSGPDAEDGLRAVRSHEEEDERDAEREKRGPDPWAVKFEPGEKINPKVCVFGVLCPVTMTKET